MDAKTFQVLYDDAVKAIRRDQLSDALSALKGLAVNLQFPADSWQTVMIPDTLQQLTENYRMLLHYWEKGVDDPARKTMHQQFLRQASEIADNYWKKTIPTFLPCGSGRMKELLQRVACLNSLKPPMLVLLGERKKLKCNVSDLLMRQILSKSNKLWLQPCFCRLWKCSI